MESRRKRVLSGISAETPAVLATGAVASILDSTLWTEPRGGSLCGLYDCLPVERRDLPVNFYVDCMASSRQIGKRVNLVAAI